MASSELKKYPDMDLAERFHKVGGNSAYVITKLCIAGYAYLELAAQ